MKEVNTAVAVDGSFRIGRCQEPRRPIHVPRTGEGAFWSGPEHALGSELARLSRDG